MYITKDVKGQSPALTLTQIIELLGSQCKSQLFLGRDVIWHSGCGNSKYPLAIFILAIFPLSVNASDSFWHCFQQLWNRCLRKKNLDTLRYVSSGHLARDHWQVGPFKTFYNKKTNSSSHMLVQGCQNLTFFLDSVRSIQILQPAI